MQHHTRVQGPSTTHRKLHGPTAHASLAARFPCPYSCYDLYTPSPLPNVLLIDALLFASFRTNFAIHLRGILTSFFLATSNFRSTPGSCPRCAPNHLHGPRLLLSTLVRIYFLDQSSHTRHRKLTYNCCRKARALSLVGCAGGPNLLLQVSSHSPTSTLSLPWSSVGTLPGANSGTVVASPTFPQCVPQCVPLYEHASYPRNYMWPNKGNRHFHYGCMRRLMNPVRRRMDDIPRNGLHARRRWNDWWTDDALSKDARDRTYRCLRISCHPVALRVMEV